MAQRNDPTKLSYTHVSAGVYSYSRNFMADYSGIEGKSFLDTSKFSSKLRNTILDALNRGIIWSYDNHEFALYHHICEHFKIRCHGLSIATRGMVDMRGQGIKEEMDFKVKLKSLWNLVNDHLMVKHMRTSHPSHPTPEYIERERGRLSTPYISRYGNGLLEFNRPVGLRKESAMRLLLDFFPEDLTNQDRVREATAAVARGDKLYAPITPRIDNNLRSTDEHEANELDEGEAEV